MQGPKPPLPEPLDGRRIRSLEIEDRKRRKRNMGFCERCGNYRIDLRRERGMFICNVCREQI